MKDEKKARAVHKQNLGVLDAPAMLALERYTGVVYQHLEYKTLRKKADARKRIVVVSGMFGAVRGGDSLPNYKLPINPWLVKFWRPLNATRLAEWAQGERVLSLLPQAYTKAVAYDLLFHVDFRVEGGKKSAGHFGKAIKGKFVRWLIENKVNRVVDIDGFKEDGYRWGGECFVKE